VSGRIEVQIWGRQLCHLFIFLNNQISSNANPCELESFDNELKVELIKKKVTQFPQLPYINVGLVSQNFHFSTTILNLQLYMLSIICFEHICVTKKKRVRKHPAHWLPSTNPRIHVFLSYFIQVRRPTTPSELSSYRRFWTSQN
jgi:hypothetical protein